jgi:hypothetical protein
MLSQDALRRYRAGAFPLALGLLCFLAGCGREERGAPPSAVPVVPGEAETVSPAKCRALDRETASALVSLSLKCVDKEYPNKLDHVFDSDESVRPPRELTPAFCGCFDWHSAVHGHWAMVRVLKTFPDLPEAPAIRAALNRHLTPANIAAEVKQILPKSNKLFERPYGWGWLLRLAAELHTWDDPDARRWEASLQPLTDLITRRTIEYLPRLSLPVRAGTHSSTAFSLAHMLDYARATDNRDLESAVERAARTFYLQDQDCPTDYEPSGEDFISPCLAEADLMRRILPPEAFASWLDKFLPPFTSPKFKPLLALPEVKDPQDPRIGHLIGLGFQRAWALKGIAAGLPPDDPRRPVLERLAELHCGESFGLISRSGYGGEHWLATFTIYYLTGCGLER